MALRSEWPSLKQRLAEGIGNCSTPTCSGTMAPGQRRLVRPQQRQRRETAVIQRLGLEVRQVELVGDQAHGDVPGQSGMAIDGGQLARAAAFIRQASSAHRPSAKCE